MVLKTILCSAIAALLAVGSDAVLVAPHGQEPLLFVGINSAARDVSQRNAARNSWMRHQLLQQSQVIARFIVPDKICSLLHPSLCSSIPPGMISDWSSRDMLSLSVTEGYHHLTAKTMALITWFNEHSTAKYLLKLDDDGYPHLDRLVRALNNIDTELAYMGDLLTDMPVVRTGPNAQSHAFPNTTYPDYMSGTGYILSSSLVGEILASGPRMLDNENVTVGLAVDTVKRMPGKRVEVISLPVQRTPDPMFCKTDDVLTLNIDVDEFQCYLEGERHDSFNKCAPRSAGGCAPG